MQIRNALSQVQMLYAQAAGEGDAGPAPESGGGAASGGGARWRAGERRTGRRRGSGLQVPTRPEPHYHGPSGYDSRARFSGPSRRISGAALSESTSIGGNRNLTDFLTDYGVVIALVCAGCRGRLRRLIVTQRLLALSPGNERMQEISGAVQEGAKAYLNRQYTIIGLVAIASRSSS